MTDFLSIIGNVTLPVFSIVCIGAIAGEHLKLDVRTLTKAAYYIFVPAFIFKAIYGSGITFEQIKSMAGFIIVTHLVAALAAGLVAKILKRERLRIASYMIIVMSGNVGNYGIAVVGFGLGNDAVGPASFYYVVLSITSLIISVAIAGWMHGGKLESLTKIGKTPALWAAVVAVFMNYVDVNVPLAMNRVVSLLSGAMIPVMLFSLGRQLCDKDVFRFSFDTAIASSMRLLLVPVIAFFIAGPFNLGALETSVGILQSGMPTAIMATIVAQEHNISPIFITSSVILSLFCSLFTLPLIIILLSL